MHSSRESISDRHREVFVILKNLGVFRKLVPHQLQLQHFRQLQHEIQIRRSTLALEDVSNEHIRQTQDHIYLFIPQMRVFGITRLVLITGRWLA